MNRSLGLNARRLCILVLFLSPAILSQAASQNESGKFRLHKYEQAIGEENYTITAERNTLTLTLKTDFRFTDFGTPVSLTPALRSSDSYGPLSFVIKGSTSTTSEIDSEVTVTGSTAGGKDTHTVPAPRTFFTIAGYAPVAMQMMMMRYWRAHGSPPRMPTLPRGAVRSTTAAPRRCRSTAGTCR